MSGKPRSSAPLSVGTDLASVLCQLRAGQTDATTVDCDRLHVVEVGLSIRFADDALAVFATCSERLRQHAQVGLDTVVGLTGGLRERGMRGDLIGFGRVGDTLWCIDKRTCPKTATELCSFDRDGSGPQQSKVALVAWLREQADELALPSALDADVAAFAPALHRRPPMFDSPGRRVRHKVFGDGVAFTETGVGPTRKVKCDFPGVGLKLLQARFLEFLD